MLSLLVWEKGRHLDLIAVDKATLLQTRPPGGQRGVMWALEVSYYQLDHNAMRHNGIVMKCNWHGYVIKTGTFCLRLSFFIEGKGSRGKVMRRKFLLWPALCPDSGLSSPVPAAARGAVSSPSPLTLDQLDALGGRGELRTRAQGSKWLSYPHSRLWKLLQVSASLGMACLVSELPRPRQAL